jgi:hypothetical protein
VCVRVCVGLIIFFFSLSLSLSLSLFVLIVFIMIFTEFSLIILSFLSLSLYLIRSYMIRDYYLRKQLNCSLFCTPDYYFSFSRASSSTQIFSTLLFLLIILYILRCLFFILTSKQRSLNLLIFLSSFDRFSDDDDAVVVDDDDDYTIRLLLVRFYCFSKHSTVFSSHIHKPISKQLLRLFFFLLFSAFLFNTQQGFVFVCLYRLCVFCVYDGPIFSPAFSFICLAFRFSSPDCCCPCCYCWMC